jgi:hypothetical protein
MAAKTFVLDFSDFKMPSTLFQDFYSKRDTIENAIKIYLDSKAKILSNYINIKNPINYIPEKYHYSTIINKYGQHILEKHLIHSEYYVFNFNIPIKICNAIVSFNIRGIYDTLRANIKNKKHFYLCKEATYIEAMYNSKGFASNIVADRVVSNSYFIYKLIMYIEQKLNISILDQRLYTNAKIKYKIEKNEEPQDKTEKQLEITYTCEKYIARKDNDYQSI